MSKGKIGIYYYDSNGKQHDAEAMIDKTNLFDFCCAMVAPGPVSAWWDKYPLQSLPNGGRSPRSVEEAEQFMRHTRSEAVKAGLWPELQV